MGVDANTIDHLWTTDGVILKKWKSKNEKKERKRKTSEREKKEKEKKIKKREGETKRGGEEKRKIILSWI